MAGEMVRAAAKLTGVPVVPAGIRGKAAEHLPVSSAALMPSHARTAAATAVSGDEAAGESMPRVAFHGLPTLEEAKEATSELIVGIEKIYPWSHDYENSVTSKVDSSFSNSQVNTSVNSEITTAPTTVYRAFRLMRECSVAQNVVASIACDPNVVKAVRENLQLQEFLRSERRRWLSSHSVTGAEGLDELYGGSKEDLSIGAVSKRGLGFEDILNIIKDMVDMIKNFSDLFQNLFGREANGDHGAPGASAEHLMETSLMGLAIMVIMLIFLKRN